MPLSDELQSELTGSFSSDDPRWQVVERITTSPCFQRSERLKAFLKYVTQQYLAGHVDRLTGHQIGRAVFGKSDGHDQAEDNTVRIYARQLRLRLLEYFDTYGREEPLILEIPKGSYVPVFRAAAHLQAEPAVAAQPESTPDILASPRKMMTLSRRWASQAWPGWIVAVILALALIVILMRKPVAPVRTGSESAFELWPLSELAAENGQTQIVLCDNNFALYQVAGRHRNSLSDYLKPEYPANIVPAPEVKDQGVEDLFDQLERKQLTSYADSAAVARIMRLSLAGTWVTRPARDIKLREVQEGNYIFLGSSWSNPWVELYEPRLNFVLTRTPPLAILNQHPRQGERSSYIAKGATGNAGDDYAALALIPNEKNGLVMILQGTKEEGTEAAGQFITSPEGRKALRDALELRPADLGHSYFEALLRTNTFAGASTQTEVVLARRVPGVVR